MRLMWGDILAPSKTARRRWRVSADLNLGGEVYRQTRMVLRPAGLAPVHVW
jgi:hypothetical protein